MMWTRIVLVPGTSRRQGFRSVLVEITGKWDAAEFITGGQNGTVWLDAEHMVGILSMVDGS